MTSARKLSLWPVSVVPSRTPGVGDAGLEPLCRECEEEETDSTDALPRKGEE